jgi:RNA polymerase sigma-70 factor, ECF subfamily
VSYVEAAEGCNVAVGTVKSRVNWACSKLAVLLDFTSKVEPGFDDVTKATLAARCAAALTQVIVKLACSG